MKMVDPLQLQTADAKAYVDPRPPEDGRHLAALAVYRRMTNRPHERKTVDGRRSLPATVDGRRQMVDGHSDTAWRTGAWARGHVIIRQLMRSVRPKALGEVAR